MAKSNKKVVGIGGIFFKCKSPQKMREWYQEHLGFDVNEYGCSFTYKDEENPQETGYLQWSPFAEDTSYFEPSDKPFMINYRVADIVALVDELKESGVTILDEITTYEYGKFVHILDPENNKIELWEPTPNPFG